MQPFLHFLGQKHETEKKGRLTIGDRRCSNTSFSPLPCNALFILGQGWSTPGTHTQTHTPCKYLCCCSLVSWLEFLPLCRPLLPFILRSGVTAARPLAAFNKNVQRLLYFHWFITGQRDEFTLNALSVIVSCALGGPIDGDLIVAEGEARKDWCYRQEALSDRLTHTDSNSV